MELYLYNTTSEAERLVKVLENEKVLDGTLRDQCSIWSPYIMVQEDDIVWNYMYIPRFKRYYYIENITAYRQGLFVIEGRIDVLMSYAEEIKKLPAIVDKISGANDIYVDGNYVVDSRVVEEKILFDNPFTVENYVLVTMKGGGN